MTIFSIVLFWSENEIGPLSSKYNVQNNLIIILGLKMHLTSNHLQQQQIDSSFHKSDKSLKGGG